LWIVGPDDGGVEDAERIQYRAEATLLFVEVAIRAPAERDDAEVLAVPQEIGNGIGSRGIRRQGARRAETTPPPYLDDFWHCPLCWRATDEATQNNQAC
jgi:hypothetical protein